MNGIDRPPVKPSQRVKLNVGGHRYETTAATLTCNGPDHYFCSLLRHTPASDFENEIFIDRDGDAFGYALPSVDQRPSMPTVPSPHVCQLLHHL